MRTSCFGIVAIVLVITVAAGCGSSLNSAKLQQSVDADWKGYKVQHGMPAGGVTVYVTTPKGNYFATSGMPSGNSPNTHFRIASNTKSFTSAAIMLLSQQAKLRIDDTIITDIPGTATPYVPDGAQYEIPHKSDITIRQLMSHTAGVFDVTNTDIPTDCAAPYAGKNYITYIEQDQGDPNHQFSPGEMVGVVATCHAMYFVPGADYKYSNTGYSILAIIIERVSGMPYDRFISQSLIVPNGLAATAVPMLASDQSLPSPYAEAFVYSSGTLTDVTLSNLSANIAEGNIISTPSNLARWLRQLIRGETGVDSASVAEMKTATPQSGTANYGLGIGYIPGLGYGHAGAHAGYLSLMEYDPATDVTIVLYFNVWDLANLVTDQMTLLTTIAKDAKKAVGY